MISSTIQSGLIGAAHSPIPFIVFGIFSAIAVFLVLLVPFTPLFIWYFTRGRILKHLDWLISSHPANPNATNHADQWSGYPVARLIFEGQPIQVVTSYKTGSNPIVRIYVGWPYDNFRLTVAPEPFGAALQKTFMGLEDIQVGSPKFDNAFLIQSSDPTSLGFVLNHQSQHLLLQMHDSGNLVYKKNSDAPPKLRQLSIAGRSLMVDAEMAINQQKLVSQIRRVIQLRDAMVAGTQLLAHHRFPQTPAGPQSKQQSEWVKAEIISPGKGSETTQPAITILEPNAKSSLSQINCLVCGEQIRNEYLSCQKCATPHHVDCWNYVGQCSIFACGGKRARIGRQ